MPNEQTHLSLPQKGYQEGAMAFPSVMWKNSFMDIACSWMYLTLLYHALNLMWAKKVRKLLE